MKPTIAIFCCDPEESWFQSMAAQCEAQWEEHEHEAWVEDAATLHEREPMLFEERAGTDPWWPPPELDPYEMIDPESSTEYGGDDAE